MIFSVVHLLVVNFSTMSSSKILVGAVQNVVEHHVTPIAVFSQDQLAKLITKFTPQIRRKANQ